MYDSGINDLNGFNKIDVLKYNSNPTRGNGRHTLTMCDNAAELAVQTSENFVSSRSLLRRHLLTNHSEISIGRNHSRERRSYSTKLHKFIIMKSCEEKMEKKIYRNKTSVRNFTSFIYCTNAQRNN